MSRVTSLQRKAIQRKLDSDIRKAKNAIIFKKNPPKSKGKPANHGRRTRGVFSPMRIRKDDVG